MAKMRTEGAVLALGNFDGVHRGHVALIAAACARAKAMGTRVCVLTFEPHPRRFFAPQLPPFRLTAMPQKSELLTAAGADWVEILPFDAALAAMSAEDFAHVLLAERFAAAHIVAGEDFRFGRARGGDMARLATWLAPRGIGVTALPPVRGQDGARYAASVVRALLQTGEVAAAAEILGRPWALRGIVVHGDQRGRQLGFPTANLDMGDYLRPRYGVYAVRVGVAGKLYNGIANIGKRPTLDGHHERLEVHLFEFSGNLYGQELEVRLCAHLRPERRFEGVESLRTQIVLDVAAAQKILDQAV